MNRVTGFHRLLVLVLLAGGYSLKLDAAEKTLQRTDDPVVMECADMKPLFGGSLDKLSLMALKNGAWTPIPFQVDQKKPDGTYAFTHGPEAGPDPDPSLDSNDELVFMARDTGDSIEDGKTTWPGGALAGIEIEVMDPKTRAKGWAYLLRFEKETPRSEKDYVRLEMDSAKKRVRFLTDEFIMEMPEGSGLPDYFVAVKPDGSQGPNTLDQLKIHLEIIVPLLKFRLDFRVDRHFRSENKAWIDGPVRVLNLNDGYLQITENIRFKMGGAVILRVYANYMESPLRMEPPEESSVLTAVIPEVNEYVFIDFTSNVYGARVVSKVSSESDDIVFDGRMSESEQLLDRRTPCDWSAMYSPEGEGGIVSRVFIDPPPSNEEVLPRLYFNDDKTIDDKPEQERGISGIGFALYNVDKGVEEMAKTNTAALLTTTIYYKNDLDPKRIETVLDMHDHPLVVNTLPVKLP